MAEGLLGGVLGDEDEKPEVEAPDALAGAEAFAAAVAAIATRQDPGVARKTEIFLDKQAQILETQNEHLKEEHALRLAHLRHQLGEENIRRFGLRLRVGFQLFLLLVATAISLGLIVMVYDAFHSRSIIIDPFEISPVLATQSMNGRIVAAGVLDRLTQLQAATRIAAQKREMSDTWTNEISIAIPETGLSISQLERILRTRFGHDQHISGDLVRTGAAGLALTVRGAGVLPKTYSDETGNLDALLTEAAEYVYGESQPALFVHYLADDVGRNGDAIAFAKSHLATASVEDQPYLLNYWGNAVSAMGDPRHLADALPFFQEAVRIKPDYWNGYSNIIFMHQVLGQEEKGVPVNEQMMKRAGGRSGKASELDYDIFDREAYNLQSARSEELADIAATGGSAGAGVGANILIIAQLDVQLHEVDTARLRLTTAVWNPKYHPDLAQVDFTQALLAEEVGELDAAAKSWDEFAAVYGTDMVVATLAPASICWAASTYEKTGQPAKADAALDAPTKTVGISTYIDCYRFRGDVQDLRGNWAGAQEWYAKAVKLAPSIPSGYYSWAIALAKHGDLAGAATKLKDSNQRQPHWADPLKAWGDVLVKQGRPKEALGKYDEALKYAPNWKELKEVRDATAKQNS